MPISSNQLIFRLSSTSASSGNYYNQTDPNLSYGKYMASSIMATGLNGLFNDITAANNAALNVDYRCIFIHNTNTSGTLTSGIVFISGEVPGGADISLGVDATAATTGSYTGVQASSISIDTNAPGGVTFASPYTYATGVAIGNIPPLYCRGIWVQRRAQNSTAINLDGFTLSLVGETTQ